jgi:hypothetical protein
VGKWTRSESRNWKNSRPRTLGRELQAENSRPSQMGEK